MKKFRHHYYNSLLKEADSKGGFVDEIFLLRSYLRELPEFFKDLHVIDFDVSDNELISCKNFPKFVERSISIRANKIKSLEGIPNIPTYKLNLSHNELTSLEYLSKFAGSKCELIISSFTQLTSCKGLENITCDKLYIYDNKISSWEYFPSSIRLLNISSNKLTSWRGMPEGLDKLSLFENWDVVDFDDFKEVRVDLSFTSARWNTSVVAEDYMRSKGIIPPYNVYVYRPE